MIPVRALIATRMPFDLWTNEYAQYMAVERQVTRAFRAADRMETGELENMMQRYNSSARGTVYNVLGIEMPLKYRNAQIVLDER